MYCTSASHQKLSFTFPSGKWRIETMSLTPKSTTPLSDTTFLHANWGKCGWNIVGQLKFIKWEFPFSHVSYLSIFCCRHVQNDFDLINGLIFTVYILLDCYMFFLQNNIDCKMFWRQNWSCRRVVWNRIFCEQNPSKLHWGNITYILLTEGLNDWLSGWDWLSIHSYR